MSAIYKKIYLVKNGEDRKKKIDTINKKLLMKHLSIRKDGVTIRIAWKKKIHHGYVNIKEHWPIDECLRVARIKRDVMLKKIGKPLSVKNIIGAVLSNTNHKGISYRPNCEYRKRGKIYHTSIFEYRWWSQKMSRYFKSRLSIRKNGGYRKALRKTIHLQKQKEEFSSFANSL